MTKFTALSSVIKIIENSGLFDCEWYLKNYRDASILNANPIHHYLWIGQRLGRKPSPTLTPGLDILSSLSIDIDHVEPPTFSTENMERLNYAILNADKSQHSISKLDIDDPKVKDLICRAKEAAGISDDPCSEIFDAQWYIETYFEQIPSKMDPWDHFVNHGRQAGLQPNEFFSPQWYLSNNPDVKKAQIDPTTHYVLYGAREGRSCGPLFVQGLYEAQLEQRLPPGKNALSHYLAQPDRERFLINPEKIVAKRLLDNLGSSLTLEPVNYAVGIVAFNQSRSEIENLIASCKASMSTCADVAAGTLILVDNSNLLSASDLPSDVHFLRSEGNVGFGRAHNRLMEVAFSAGSSCYIGANPDGAFHPDCITNLLRMNQRHKGRALIEALQFPEEHPKFYHPESLETAWCSGACFLISKAIFDATKGFDPNIFLYCEDVDLSWQALSHGFKTMTCPTALFYHDVSDREYSEFIRKEMLLAGRYLAKKWGSLDFLKHTEESLISENFFEHLYDLPDLDDMPDLKTTPWFSNFERLFSFSSTRW